MPEPNSRKVEDRLREEYFDRLPEFRRAVEELEVRVRYLTLPVLHKLRPHEKLVIRSRVKEFASVLAKLQRKVKGAREGRILPPDIVPSVLTLRDIVGVRVLAFPDERVLEIDQLLRPYFPNWVSDPIPYEGGLKYAPKYVGYCETASREVMCEYQIVPMLVGLFWDVEHAAMYKHDLVAKSKGMLKRRAKVESALAEFEKGVVDLLPSRDG